MQLGTILDSCYYEDDKALEAYETTLESKKDLMPNHLTMVIRQQASICAGHDKVKALFDEAIEKYEKLHS